VHIVFYKEDQLLFLFVIPDRICRLQEACLLTEDLARNLCFQHQSLLRYISNMSNFILPKN